jgi:hypothetical protein
VKGGARGAAKGVGEHDYVFGVEERGTRPVYEVEAIRRDGDVVGAGVLEIVRTEE